MDVPGRGHDRRGARRRPGERTAVGHGRLGGTLAPDAAARAPCRRLEGCSKERPGPLRAQLRRSRRTAQTLYSGIFDTGSAAALVRKLAAESDSLTNGTKTAPARTASVTRAWPVSSPRRETTRS